MRWNESVSVPNRSLSLRAWLLPPSSTPPLSSLSCLSPLFSSLRQNSVLCLWNRKYYTCAVFFFIELKQCTIMLRFVSLLSLFNLHKDVHFLTCYDYLPKKNIIYRCIQSKREKKKKKARQEKEKRKCNQSRVLCVSYMIDVHLILSSRSINLIWNFEPYNALFQEPS